MYKGHMTRPVYEATAIRGYVRVACTARAYVGLCAVRVACGLCCCVTAQCNIGNCFVLCVRVCVAVL